jgi:hypothetical protein
MATVHPPLHTIQVMFKGPNVEFQVLSQLAAGLPDAFEAVSQCGLGWVEHLHATLFVA